MLIRDRCRSARASRASFSSILTSQCLRYHYPVVVVLVVLVVSRLTLSVKLAFFMQLTRLARRCCKPSLIRRIFIVVLQSCDLQNMLYQNDELNIIVQNVLSTSVTSDLINCLVLIVILFAINAISIKPSTFISIAVHVPCNRSKNKTK